MNSKLLIGSTYHHRFSPKKHSFYYKTFQFFIDLDEVETLNNRFKLLGTKKLSAFRFLESDHSLGSKQTLKDAIMSKVQVKHPQFEPEKIYLLGNLRTLGHIFNPVCFYFVQDKDLNTVVVIEIMNTYYEHKTYVSDQSRMFNDEFNCEYEFDKNFYISPFSSSNGKMAYKITWNKNKEIAIHVKNYENFNVNVYANLTGELKEIDERSLFFLLLRFPLITITILLQIHLQALILYLRGVKYYSKDEEIQSQKGYELWKQ